MPPIVMAVAPSIFRSATLTIKLRSERDVKFHGTLPAGRHAPCRTSPYALRDAPVLSGMMIPFFVYAELQERISYDPGPFQPVYRRSQIVGLHESITTLLPHVCSFALICPPNTCYRTNEAAFVGWIRLRLQICRPTSR